MSATEKALEWDDGIEQRLQEWSATGSLHVLMDHLKKAYSSFQDGKPYDSKYIFLNRPLQKGFFIRFDKNELHRNEGFVLLYHLVHRLKGIQYVQHLHIEKDNGEHYEEYIYLKPGLYRLIAHPNRSLLYGNISIKCIYNHDGTARSLQVQCDQYAQRGDTFEPFEELMGYLVQVA